MAEKEIQLLIARGLRVTVTTGWYLPPHTRCVEVRREA